MKSKNEILNEVFTLSDSALSTAVDKKEIIANLFAYTPTLAGNVTMMTGAKANTTVEVPILSTDITWSTADCWATTSGNTTLGVRNISVKRLADRQEMCLDTLDAKLPQIQAAGARNEELPFAALYIDLKVKENAKQLEKAIWRNNVTGGTGNLATFNGILAIADSENASLNAYRTFTGTTAALISAEVDYIMANRSEAQFEAEDFTIFMSESSYHLLNQYYVATYGIAGVSMFANTGQENAQGHLTMWYPGTQVKIKATPGLASNNSIFALPESEIVFATDLESDKETVELFFDKYHKALVSDLVFAFGVTYKFPANVSYSKKI